MDRVATYPCCPAVPTAGGRISRGSSEKWKILFFWGPRKKAWISEWLDNIRNSPQVGPVAVRSGKTYVLRK